MSTEVDVHLMVRQPAYVDSKLREDLERLKKMQSHRGDQHTKTLDVGAVQ
uniref:Uncharacterized protein n=1 Tax=Glossina palpalis gambiensis TaxID=67801 RepID=A0A1B0BQZ9_9MUSC